MSTFLIFPNQLFSDVLSVIKARKDDVAEIWLVEEPLYFGWDPVFRPYNISKLKLAFHRASMRAFYDYLKVRIAKTAVKALRYIEYSDALLSASNNKLFAGKQLCFIDPVDHVLVKQKYAVYKPAVWTDHHPSFIASMEELSAFHRPSTRHAAFFAMIKKRHPQLMIDLPYTDEQNRQPLPKDWSQDAKSMRIPTYTSKYHREAAMYVNGHSKFKDNYGSTEALKYYPVTQVQARKHLKHFLEQRFAEFGTFQDAFHADATVLYHAHISCALNAGLLTPVEVLHAAKSRYERGGIPANSYEGFVRQVGGWREYMRYIYMFHEEHLRSAEHGHAGKHNRSHVDVAAWYTGSTGIAPLDNEIRKAMQFGYAHHIVRLMMFLNIMIMCGLTASSIVQWFTEVVCMDAYEWVMLSNVVAMGGFSNRFMNKPYLSTSNYLRTMSSQAPYKNHKDEVWDALYYYALKNLFPHAQVYGKNNKMADVRAAEAFIQKFTKPSQKRAKSAGKSSK